MRYVGEASAALREASPNLSDGLRDTGPSLRTAGGCDLRPLSHAGPRENPLPRHRLRMGDPLLSREHGLPRCRSRDRRAGRGLLQYESPARGEILPCGLRLGQAQPRGRRPLAAGAAQDPDLLGPRSAYGSCPRSAAFRGEQPPFRTTRLQGCRPPATRRAGQDLQRRAEDVPAEKVGKPGSVSHQCFTAISSRVVCLVRRKEEKPPTTNERPNHAHPTPNMTHNTAPKEPKSCKKEIRPHSDPRTKGSRPQVGKAPSRGDVTAKRIDPTAKTSSPTRKAL